MRNDLQFHLKFHVGGTSILFFILKRRKRKNNTSKYTINTLLFDQYATFSVLVLLLLQSRRVYRSW